jgi:hypothetical protein
MYLDVTVQHKVKDFSNRGDLDPRVLSSSRCRRASPAFLPPPAIRI